MDAVHILLLIKVLLLLAAANGAPVLAADIFKRAYACPIDGGLRFIDGERIFGPSKTLRGVLSSVVVTAAAALVLGFSPLLGATVALLAMLGDLTSSFIKRRLRRPPSSMALGLDQIPEALFPLLALRAPLGLSAMDIVILVAAFIVFELLASRILFRLRLRDRPY